jgi:UDP-N-acetylglucosamine 2-epimerase (non-hydrolysing)
MLDQMLNLFNIKPDIDLNLMEPDQSLAELSARIFKTFDPVLEQLKPDWVIVQGDTTTVMIAALSAFYRKIRVGHVEAGLRSHDRTQPFPEEMNRRVASVTADLHFAPTRRSRQNLLDEGIEDWRIAVTGNPVIDALQSIIHLPAPLEIEDLLIRLGIINNSKKLILIEAHRRESFGKPLLDICEAIRQIASKYSNDLEFVWPVHLNPRIENPVQKELADIDCVHLMPPAEYLSLVHLLKASHIVLTDSGGIQEEATGLGKPTLVLRQITERPEGVEAGVLKLVGTNVESIVSNVELLLTNSTEYTRMSHKSNLFGDGHAAEHIVKALLSFNAK